VKSDDVFETFMNAFANTMDPHTSYYSPRNSEEYRIQMSLNYDGIGATLQLQDEYVAVINVIEGGPAALDGTLKPKDRIVGVGQGEDGEIVDVVGWRLDEVVDLIRGPGGSTVRLQVLPGGAAPGSPAGVIPLVRDKVKLEAQAARKQALEVERGGRNPPHRRDHRAVLLPGLQRARLRFPRVHEHDRRRAAPRAGTRGGRHRRAGAGPAQQRRRPPLRSHGHDRPVPARRPDRAAARHQRARRGARRTAVGPVYDGPLAVLVNRFSASASEIFAAAIQDYGRGVVIGQQTYGKGTVQNLYPLDRYAPGADPRFGQLTLTIGKYYRVTGESTQHRGVIPDIVVPSPIDTHMVGESSRETALPWDQIRDPLHAAGRPRQGDRAAGGGARAAQRGRSGFPHLLSDIEALEERRSRKIRVAEPRSAPRGEASRFEAERLARENQRREALGLEPAGLAGGGWIRRGGAPMCVLQEAAAVVADLARCRRPSSRKQPREGQRD
jgi:carboxyl-terminal processing protease